MTDIDRCPRCHHRLPRRLHFTHPDEGAEILVGVIGSGIGLVGLIYAIARSTLSPDRDMQYVAAESALAGIVYAELGIWTSLLRWWLGLDKRRPPEDDDGSPHGGGDVGDAIRQVDASGGRVRYLREAGYHVPPEPRRGALAKWLWAVVDGDVSFSQRGARTVHPDNSRTRNWAKEVMALWCHAGWCEPSHGWNGDEPVLDGGVRDVDMDMVRRCASGGQMEMIAALLEQVDRGIEERVHPPHSTVGEGGG